MRIPLDAPSTPIRPIHVGTADSAERAARRQAAAGDDIRAPRTMREVAEANARAPGGPVDGRGEADGTYSTERRARFGPEGTSAAALGQAALERMLADTAVPSQIQNDEFEVIRHDNGRYTVVLPGVIDLRHPHWGLDTGSRSVRDVDQFALPSSHDASVASNRYAQMVREHILATVPRGAEVMLVGHSYGADTAVDLAADPVFNNPDSGVRVTHVVAAAYFNQPQLGSVPAHTQVLVLQNANDAAVIGEGLGYTATEARGAAGRAVGETREAAGDLFGLGGSILRGDLGGIRDHAGDLLHQADELLLPPTLPWPDAAALLRTGVTRPDAHTIVARFDGGTAGVGHHQSNYIDYLNGAGGRDPAVRGFLASVADAGYAAPGQTEAVDVSVSDVDYRTTYPGDGAVERARNWWDRIPGSGFVERAAGAGAGWVGDAASTVWDQRGHVADARDAVRDGAVSGWNALPGNDAVESVVGSIGDHLPFNNAAGAALRALAGAESITLDSDATAAIQRDPDFVQTEAQIVERIRALDGYGERELEVSLSELGTDLTVELGGQRGAGGMFDQLKRAWDLRDPEIRATWGVAGNELTWLLRHARLDGTAHVDADGSITIDYRISDTLDLRPGPGRSDAYNAVTTLAGTLWHDVLGAEEAAITGEFSRTLR